MGLLLCDVELLKQATIIVDNARSPLVTASHSTYSEIPALCCLKAMPKKRTVSKSGLSAKCQKRCASFPAPEKSRWDSMSLLQAKSATMSTSLSLTNLPYRYLSSDAMPKIDGRYCIVNVPADSMPRQPRRHNSFSTISILDQALDVMSHSL
jgi:hypothetical protein